MESEQSKQLHELISSLQQSDKVKEELIQKLTKPNISWGKKKNAPYYREKFALEIRNVFDLLKKTFPQPFIYRYEKFPEFSSRTIYLRIYQSKRYLLDHLDPTGAYTALDQVLKVRAKAKLGIVLTLRLDMMDNFMPEALTTEEEKKTLKQEIDGWLNNEDDSTQFTRGNLTLTDDEVKLLKASLDGLETAAYKITNDTIKIIKL